MPLFSRTPIGSRGDVVTYCKIHAGSGKEPETAWQTCSELFVVAAAPQVSDAPPPL